MTWGWGSVKPGSTATLFIQSKWGAGRSIAIEAFWLDSLDAWHSVPNIELGLPNQIALTGDTTPYTWTARALPESLGAPPSPRIVVRLPDQTATSNLITLLPPDPAGEPDPQPWPGSNPNGTGSEPGEDRADNPKLRTLKFGVFGGMPSVLVELPQPEAARLDVYDLQGRRVRNLADRELPAGATVHAWDGRDESGRRMGAGVYFARLTTPQGRFTARILLR